MNGYRIKHTVEIVITARNKEEALEMAYKQEFRAIDLIEFKCGAKIKNENKLR